VAVSRNNIVANPEGLSAACVLASFAEWMDLRLAEAMRLDMDLAFRDRPFDVEIDRTPALVGWEHCYLQPGAPAPRGRAWTVYRLQDQAAVGAPDRKAATGQAEHRQEMVPLLDTLGYLGIFDGTPAEFAVGRRPSRRR